MIKAFCGICESTISIKESELERSIDLRIAKTKKAKVKFSSFGISIYTVIYSSLTVNTSKTVRQYFYCKNHVQRTR